MAFDGILRQSTAVDVLIGPFVDSTDGVTPETGLTIQVDVSKNGQALADRNDVTNPVHDAAGTVDGYYNCELDATDTNTVGSLVLACFSAGALQVRHAYQVVEENVYDAFFAASATGGTDLAAILVDTGTTLDARIPAALVSGRMDASVGAMAANVLTATAINADAITAAKVAADVSAEIADAVLDEDMSAHQTQGSLGQAIGDPVADTNTIYKAVVTDAAGATVGVDVVAVKAETAAILVDTGTTLQAELDAIEAAVITNAAGVDIAADIIALKAETAAILVDTGTTLDGKLDTIDNFLDTEIAAILSDTNAILVDTGTTLQAELDGIQADTEDIQTRLPAALIGGRMDSDVEAINNSTVAADVLAVLNGATVVYQGTVTGAATTTTLIDTGLTQADTDWWKGRIIIFTSVVTLQATDITAFDPATDKLTFTALTAAPTAATYVII